VSRFQKFVKFRVDRQRIPPIRSLDEQGHGPHNQGGNRMPVECAADRITEGGGLKEEGEDIEVVEVTLMEAASMVAAGEIVDAKTVILIQYLSDRARASQRD
jgi:hypothetical protein